MARFLVVVLCLLTFVPWAQVRAAIPAREQSNAQVMESFAHADDQTAVKKLSDEKRHRILFVMGFALLLFISITAGLGIAMVLFGKRVFVAHMIFAGFSVTLALAHAIAAVVWFFPF